jgi:hypothetical protein
MVAVDKEIASLAVFNQRDDQMAELPGSLIEEDTGKFSNVSSVQQLRLILRNYEALTESQHHLLNQSITKMAKIPPPDEITQTFNRF